KPKQILQKYKIEKPKELPEEEKIFDLKRPSPFFEEIKREVSEKVFKNGDHYATFGRWLQILGFFILIVICFPFYIKGYWFSIIVFPFLLWIWSVNTLHDASHFALSKNWII